MSPPPTRGNAIERNKETDVGHFLVNTMESPAAIFFHFFIFHAGLVIGPGNQTNTMRMMKTIRYTARRKSC